MQMELVIASEREALWTQIIGGKYEEEGWRWLAQVVREGYSVGFWKVIRKD